MITFSEFRKIIMEYAVDPASASTQVHTNRGTVKKAGDFLRAQGVTGKVLHHGAGANVEKEDDIALSPKGDGSDVESFEPFPNKHAKKKPTYTKAEDVPRKKYKGVVSTSVLNVIPNTNGERDGALKHIGESLAPGGHAVISARHRNDVESAKSKIPHPTEKGAYYIPKKNKETGENMNVFQKGFDHDEFHGYVKKTLGDRYEVTRSNALNGVCVHVRRKEDHEE